MLAYEKAMRTVAARLPDDFEAQAWYALAVLAVGYATPNDAKLSNQLQAAGVLEKLWKQNPKHPGVTHYLIHSYDYPSLARRGLPAANAYASIAPWVPHALHMPSHIYTRLGMWEEAIASNRASADAARDYAASLKRDATEAQELHALDYMAYSYLQQGRDAEAKKIVDFVATVRQTNPELEFSAAYALAAVPARDALERNAWSEAAALRVPEVPHWTSFPFMEALVEYSRALGRAHLGDLDGARTALERMRELRGATMEPKFRLFQTAPRPANAGRLRLDCPWQGRERRSDCDPAPGRGRGRPAREASGFARRIGPGARAIGGFAPGPGSPEGSAERV